MEVSYYSECDTDYTKGLNEASKDLKSLKTYLSEWRWIAQDALDVANKMTEDDFIEFKEGLEKERNGKYSSDSWVSKFGAILIPEMLFKVSNVAMEFHVPWGTAYIRLKENKMI